MIQDEAARNKVGVEVKGDDGAVVRAWASPLYLEASRVDFPAGGGAGDEARAGVRGHVVRRGGAVCDELVIYLVEKCVYGGANTAAGVVDCLELGDRRRNSDARKEGEWILVFSHFGRITSGVESTGAAGTSAPADLEEVVVASDVKNRGAPRRCK